MRKYLYAGVVAGCFLLLGAAPAYADAVPAPHAAQAADGQQPDGSGPLDGLLDPANGLSLDQPLGGSPLIDVNPGDNSLLPHQDGEPAARTGFGTAGAQERHTRPRPNGSLPLPVSGGGLPTGALSQLPIGQLLGGGLPLIGGLLPDGQSPIGGLTRSQEAGLLDGGLPLLGGLGGLGGLLPASNVRTLPALSGLPAGGTAIDDQPVQARPARIKPAKSEPARPQPAATPADPATANDARLHEEPTDPADRTFSTGRPVAGQDPEYR